jgi:RHS repeat-associated protein
MDVRQSVEKADGSVPAVLNATYSWDKAGNLTAIKDNPHTGAGSPDRQCFTYDWARRLSQAWTPAGGDCTAARSVAALGGADPYWNTYTYEVTGNREAVTARTPGGTTTAQYAHPAQGATSVRPHAVDSVTTTGQTAGVSQFTWDAAGSMITRAMPDGKGGRATQSLTWDAEGELAAVGQDGNADGDVVDAGEAVAGGEYVYTADGERLVRTQGSGTARKTTVYLPGGQEVTAASGQVSAVRYYSFAGKTIAVRTGMLIDETSTITPDHHGTGSLQISYLTNTVTRRHVDPFGAERGTAGPSSPGAGVVSGWAGDHGFLDKPADVTGLTAVGARMYDSGLGLFASVDPVKDLADPQQWSAYAYANNNPTTNSDPTGLHPGYTLDPASGGGCGCDNGYRGDDSDGDERGDGGGESGGQDGGLDTSPPTTDSWGAPQVLSPEVCPACWGLVPVAEVTYPDYRPQWLANFEQAHPNIAAYSGISDYSGCFLRGGMGDSCGYVLMGALLIPVGGALSGASAKAGAKTLARAGGQTAATKVDEAALLSKANALRNEKVAELAAGSARG